LFKISGFRKPVTCTDTRTEPIFYENKNLKIIVLFVGISLSGGFCMEPPSSRPEEPPSWEDLYKINLMPSELFLKFRKELQGLRVGVNLEVFPSLCSTKL